MSNYFARLRNVIPIELNFILYIDNIYSNHFSKQNQFPGSVRSSDGLLAKEDYSVNLIKCWDRLLLKYNEEHAASFFTNINIEESFSILFSNDYSGSKALFEHWENYCSWWWPDYGIKSFLERFSDIRIPEISDMVSNIARENDHFISDRHLSLIMVFKKPPESLKRQDKHFHIAYLAEILKSDISQIPQSMFNNITGK